MQEPAAVQEAAGGKLVAAKSKYIPMGAAACAILISSFSFPAPVAASDPAFEKGWREDSLLSSLEYFNSRTRKTVRVAEHDPCYQYDMTREYQKQEAACTKDIGTEEFNQPSIGFGVTDRYYNRGNAYYEMGAYDKAMADYDKTIERAPGLLYAYNNRGLLYYRKGEYERAIEDFSQALKDSVGIYSVSRPLINRGDAYFMQGDYRRAIADYTGAIRRAPSDFLRASLGNASYRGDQAKARSEYRRAISGAYYKRGLAYRRTGQLEKAAADQQNAIGIMRDTIELPGLAAED